MHTARRESRVLLLHVGLPKTATTALQVHVFEDLPGVRSIGKPSLPKPLKKALRCMINRGERDFSASHLAAVRAALHDACAGGAAILSHEGLTAAHHEMRGSDRFLRRAGFRAQRALVAQRLREACDEAEVQVLFTVREQCSWLVSLYADLVERKGLGIPFESWVERGLEDPDGFAGDPDFSWLIDVYAARFGTQNVHVVAFEDLRGVPERFAAKLAAAGCLEERELRRRVACLPREKAREDLAAIAAVSVSRPAKNRHDGGCARPEIPQEMPAALRARVRALCREGNRRLEARYGVPLAELGYAS